MKRFFMLACVLYGGPAFAGGGLDMAMRHSLAGLKAQSSRMNVAAQNLANQDSVADSPGGEPYRRKIIVLGPRPDPDVGETVAVLKTDVDRKAPFEARYDPAHPAADTKGYVLYPNVSGEIEEADVKESERSYEANLSAMQTSRAMFSRTLDMLR